MSDAIEINCFFCCRFEDALHIGSEWVNYDMDNAGDVFSHTSASHYEFDRVTGEKSMVA